MHICILSMQDVQNMGSLLQSYALSRILRSFNMKVGFLPIESRDKDNMLLQGSIDDFQSEAESSGGLSKIKKLDKYFINRIRNKKLRKRQFEFYNTFREKYLTNNCFGIVQTYDYCIIGSDEVFNCCNRTKWGLTSQLFGDVKEANHVITYAASCGSTIAKSVPPKASE